MKAIRDVLKKIDRLNATAKTLRETTPDDTLSLDGILRFRQQLVDDLIYLLAEFDLNLRQSAVAA